MSNISASTSALNAFKIVTDLTGNLVFQTGSVPTTAVTMDTAQNMSVIGNISAVSYTGTVVSVTGNITGGNILATTISNAASHTGAIVSVTGNITGGNVLATTISNAASFTGGLVSVTGNITANNLSVVSNVVVASTGTLAIANTGNAALSATGNVFGGNIRSLGALRSSGVTAGIGYFTGAGLSNTQATNRATSVTINAVTGTITLFSVAGNTTPTTFTFLNSTIATTDLLLLNQRSGTNIYLTWVSNVGTGQANITVYTTGGVVAEAPSFNFAVLKGNTA